jgi:hypothetical protein
MYEAVTAYMPTRFSSFWTFDPASDSLRASTDKDLEQNLPVILSTPDQNYAMGIYTPDSHTSETIWDHLGYGFTAFPAGEGVSAVNKWSSVYRFSDENGLVKERAFRSFVIVGSLENVRISMLQLYNKFN